MVKKRVLVTGAAGALGQVAVERMVAGGWEVVATARGTLPARPGVRGVTVDLADAREVESRLTPALGEIGGVHALLHCAGGFRYGALPDLDWSDVEFLWESNLRSALLVTRAVVPGMRALGGGELVFVGARGALAPAPGMSVYAAMKAGLHALVTSLDAELTPYGIRAHAVLPGIIDTPANRAAMPGADRKGWVTTASLVEVMANLLEQAGLRDVRGALIPVSGAV